MSTPKYLLLSSFLLISLCGTDASIKTLTRSLTTDKELWYSNRHPSPRSTYLSCELRTDIDHLTYDCQVTREKSPFSKDTETCKVTLELCQSSGHVYNIPPSIGAIPLANDVVLLYLSEKSYYAYVRFVTVNMNDCKKLGSKEIRFFNPADSADQAMRIVPFDDSYEVHYLETQSETPDLKHMRIVLDVEGKMIGGPTAVDTVQRQEMYVKSPLPDILPIAKESRDKGVVYLKKRNDAVLPRLTVLRYDGTKKNFEVLEGNANLWKNESRYLSFSLSTDHNVITVCSTVSFENPTFKCLQFGADGKLNFATDFIEDRETKYVNMATYNLPDGGFFTAALNFYEMQEKPKYIDSSVFKFDTKGKVVGKVFLKNFISPDAAESGISLFYKNEKGEYCLKASTHDNKMQKSLTLTAQCFTDADFAPYSSNLL